MTNSHNFLVYIEADDSGVVTPLSLEVLNAAKQIVVKENTTVSALVIGECASLYAEELQYHNVDKIYIKEDPALKHYQPRRFLAVFEKVYRMLEPGLAIFGNSKNSFGRI